MSLLVVGSVAFDTITTPFGKCKNVLGGSATFFSVSASFFSPVNLVAVVGKDFPESHIRFLNKKGVDTKGLVIENGKTFSWEGEYNWDFSNPRTIATNLNVFADFNPKLPREYRNAPYVFLANIDPELQLEVLQQVKNPKLVACDTMNFWIEGKKAELIKTLAKVDILVINEAEVRQLADESNLLKAAEIVRSFGPKTLVVKRGEYGVLMFGEGSIFSAPAFPLEEVFDPTGAGDTFAGGFIGYLAATRNLEEQNLRKATVFGTVMASFTVEKFSLDRLKEIEYSEIADRYKKIKLLTEFADID